MLSDILFKLARKSLGRGPYRFLAEKVGRARAWRHPDMARGILEYYLSHGLDFRDKRVLELGGGAGGAMGPLLLEAGARQVFLVDPKLEPGSDGEGRVLRFRDIAAIPARMNGRIEVLCSHHCLEHVEDPDALFSGFSRLLSPEGISHHRVDLSDHTYHFLSRYPRLARLFPGRALFHLRYSERAFRRLNDPKCYMNRRLLPDYADLAARHGLRLEVRDMRLYSPVRVSRDILDRYAGHPLAYLRVVEFVAEMTRAGRTGIPGAPGIPCPSRSRPPT